MRSKKLNEMEEELQHEKKAHKGLVGTLKKHFKGDEKHMREEEIEEEKLEKRAPRKEGHKNMSKDDRKRAAIIIMKKKMG